MKITIKTIIAIVLFSISMATAQIGINTSNPDDSSMLDVTSTDKGMLVPRMTEAQRIAITLPATGLLVYQTNNTDGFWYYDGSAWVNLNAATGEFQRFGNIVRNTTDTATDDFVFGSTSLEDVGPNGDKRMFFDKSKGAFRVGSVEGSQWNDSNVGNYSTAFGYITTASGDYSTAFGSSTTASGAYSTAFGSSTTASGFYSTAFGLGTSASGYFSTAIGRFTTASGDFSTAMGRNTYARSYGETALGLFNTDYTPSNVFSFNANDRLFTIGNGSSNSNRSNAMVVLKNGNTGFGTSTPSATLDVEGTFQLVDGNQSAGKVLTSDAAGNATWQTNTGAGEFQRFGNIIRNTTNTATDDFLFGNLDFSDNIDRISRRMFFDKSKGAFRVGGIDGTQWNDANVGIYSTAFGFNTTASGAYSTAMGVFTTASGVFSTALGHQNNAPSVAETTIGSLSTIYTPGSNFAWVPTDRLFTIGNGSTQNFIRSDAMVVLKNGNTGLGTSTPSATLDVEGTFQLVDGNQSAGKVLTSDAFGNATWQNAPSSDTDWVISGSNLYSGVSGNVGIGTTTPADKLVVSGGRVEFTATTDASGSTGSGVLEIANSLRFDGNEIITNTDSPLYIQNDNNGDLFVDGSTLSVIANTNRVGIGTTTPSDKLVVSGGRVEFTATTDASGTEGTGVLEIGNNLRLDNNEIITNTNSTLYLQRDNNGDLVVDDYTFMVDASANHVGIGTNAPTQAKLVVNGSNGSNIGNHAFFNSSGNTGSSSSTKAYSIYASHNIATAQLNVFSDERIKNIQGITNSKEDLETLAQIEITDYTLKDSIGMGKETIKKVIAQQVKQVYPQAVSSTLTDVIPDIYQLAEIEKGWINLKTDLAVGDKVKLIFSETEDLFEVTEVSTTAFKVNSEQEGKVFVFGKEVQDFHTVDYEAISMLNVSATQELLKRIELLESENSNLKAETANQELQLNALDKRLQLLESNFQNTNNQQSK